MTNAFGFPVSCKLTVAERNLTPLRIPLPNAHLIDSTFSAQESFKVGNVECSQVVGLKGRGLIKGYSSGTLHLHPFCMLVKDNFAYTQIYLTLPYTLPYSLP